MKRFVGIKKMKLQKTFLTCLFLLIAAQILVSCVGNTEDKVVSLQLLEVSNGKALLELSNETNKPIYLAYSASDINDLKIGFVYYNLHCKVKGENEYKHYGITSHGVPSLEALDKGGSVHFEAKWLPVTEASCKMSVMYYDNKDIADLINNKILELTESEIELAERSKRFIELNIDLIPN